MAAGGDGRFRVSLPLAPGGWAQWPFIIAIKPLYHARPPHDSNPSPTTIARSSATPARLAALAPHQSNLPHNPLAGSSMGVQLQTQKAQLNHSGRQQRREGAQGYPFFPVSITQRHFPPPLTLAHPHPRPPTSNPPTPAVTTATHPPPQPHTSPPASHTLPPHGRPDVAADCSLEVGPY
jgi:hypothetical protein